MEAVYSASRNLYPYLLPSIMSLLDHNKVDNIYLMIEDDELPYQVPDVCRCINVSDQRYFGMDGPNFRSQFTYMALMRSTYTDTLPPDLPRVLQLDVDTIITDDLTGLWEMPLDDKWLAACPEYLGKYRPFGPTYYNIGVALFNLDRIRDDGIDKAIIHDLQTHFRRFLEQDAWNFYAVPLGKIADIDVRYNECFATGMTDHPAVVHYAGFPAWMTMQGLPRGEYLDQYRKYYRT